MCPKTPVTLIRRESSLAVYDEDREVTRFNCDDQDSLNGISAQGNAAACWKVALLTFFPCYQGHSHFPDYTAALAEARNALGEKVIDANLYKYHLLLLRILALPNLPSLMFTQWESLIPESAGYPPYDFRLRSNVD
ncbi:hypothetical protein M422DRAFT_252988 [Sphaerobolus stellatus SS14]|uniref:Uncharacterized protein n=1 Tax=Sphaerobolus stellatus (strain SS14) TaxID=990650 RepID=A0A0C9VXS8_SPHS4|nr:hypothetical protein M422DRAFT_252988 [Sphaerobolus stellatus SS14]